MPFTDLEKHKQTIKKNKTASRRRLQQYVLDYLKTHSCADCGESNPVVLDFDHRDPKEKSINVSRIVSDCGSLDRLLIEIVKCDVRCANCHRIRHIQTGGKYDYITKTRPREMSAESREKIRQSKIGKSPTEETRTKISQSLQGNTCRKINDLVGKTFGRLTVLKQSEKRNRRVYWLCQCLCGRLCVIAGIKMTTGCTKSCGCLRQEFTGNQFTCLSRTQNSSNIN